MGVAADTASAAREQFMLTSIEQARRSMAAGGPPVGACLVRNGNLLARSQNAVAAELDITAHAEIMLLRQACKELRSLNLSGCEIYVTVEPCMMCYAACSYANIKTIFFGAPVSAMNRYTGNEVPVCNAGNISGHQPEMVGGILETQCIELLNAWGNQLPESQQ